MAFNQIDAAVGQH